MSSSLEDTNSITLSIVSILPKPPNFCQEKTWSRMARNRIISGLEGRWSTKAKPDYRTRIRLGSSYMLEEYDKIASWSKNQVYSADKRDGAQVSLFGATNGFSTD